ncbi:TPA: TniB family NTP-binding protein [Raoultella ornithinolytica]
MKLSSVDEEKLSAFVRCYIETHLLHSIEEDFDRLRYNKQLGAEPQCMLLTGDTGAGKTYFLQNYMRKFPDQNKNGFVKKPLLVSRIPSKPSIESSMIELLKDLGQWGSVYRRNKSSAENLTESLIKCLLRCETELIIIDEFQELIENKSRESRNQIANRLKYLSEKARIPIVLVGMPWCTKIAEEPQWASRLLIRRTIPYFMFSEDLQTFIRLVMGFTKRMPFIELPKLENNKHTILALYAACNGCIRILKHLLDESLKQALFTNSNTLSHEHLSLAYSIFYPDKDNPFLLPIDDIKIFEVKQYSRYEIDETGKEERLFPQQLSDRIPISQLLKK